MLTQTTWRTWNYVDVLANYVIDICIRITSQFRMVAERVHHQRAGHPKELHQGPVRDLLHEVEVQQQAERELLPGYDFVYSALLVKPTLLDPTSVSATTWYTSTRCSSDINMLTTPKQQQEQKQQQQKQKQHNKNDLPF
eukprot:132699-Amphidinium_carterae.1